MVKSTGSTTHLGFLVAVCLVIATGSASSASLENQINDADKQMFEAFNQCDLDSMANMFTEDLEFYHDIAGVSDYTSTLAATKRNCERQLGLIRTLIADSVTVYPIKDFGAIQQGKHTFCHLENGKNDCGTFGFTHIWQITPSGWKISRVVSYGH